MKEKSNKSNAPNLWQIHYKKIFVFYYRCYRGMMCLWILDAENKSPQHCW